MSKSIPALLIVLLLWSGTPETGHTDPPPSGRIVFVSNRDVANNFEIYSVNADGGGLQRLTSSPGFDGDAKISPDGAWVTFYSTRSGREEIYFTAIDGSVTWPVTNTTVPEAVRNFCPSLSPNQSFIAFTSTRDGDDDIFVMNNDGTGLRRMTTQPSLDMCPSWSPDGQRMVYSADFSQIADSKLGRNLFVAQADGSDIKQLTFLPHATLPAWSPNSNRIAFQSYTSLYLVDADGTNLTRLGLGERPAWSPDGNWLAVVRQNSILLLSVDGVQTYQMSLPPTTVQGAQIRSVSWGR